MVLAHLRPPRWRFVWLLAAAPMIIKRGCVFLLALLVWGMIWFACSAEPTSPTVEMSVTQEHQAKQLCKDSTGMTVTDYQDLGAQQAIIDLKGPRETAECLVQFGKIQHISRLMRTP